MAIKGFMTKAERAIENRGEAPRPPSLPAATPAPRAVSPATSIDASSQLEGRLSCKQTLRIDGWVKGEIECDKAVLIGEEANIFADITADEVQVAGVVEGDMTARRKITLQKTAVVVGDLGDEFAFRPLNEAFRCLHEGARLIATQKNRYWKAADGWTLDAGAFVAALEYAARTEATVVGKPSPGFFRMAAALLDVEPAALTIVGDDVESDVAGGRAAGLRTVLVRTGKFDAERVAQVPPDQQPDLTIDSIKDLPAALDG